MSFRQSKTGYKKLINLTYSEYKKYLYIYFFCYKFLELDVTKEKHMFFVPHFRNIHCVCFIIFFVLAHESAEKKIKNLMTKKVFVHLRFYL